MLHHVCPWAHSPLQLLLAARMATPLPRVATPPWHLPLTRFSVPQQVEGGTPGSRDTPDTAHAGTAESALLTSVSGVASRGGGAAVSCGPSALAKGWLCWGDPAQQGWLQRATCRLCPHVVSEPTPLSALLSGSQHQGWERGHSCDRPSLPLTGEVGHMAPPAKPRGGEGGMQAWGRPGVGPTGCSYPMCPTLAPLASVLVLGRAEGCSEG